MIQIAIIAIIAYIIGSSFGFYYGAYSYIAMIIASIAFDVYRLKKYIRESGNEK